MESVYPSAPSAPDFDDLSKPHVQPPHPAGYVAGSQSNEFSTTPNPPRSVGYVAGSQSNEFSTAPNQFARPINQPTGSQPMYHIQPYPGPPNYHTGPPPPYQPPNGAFVPSPGNAFNQPPYPATNLRPGPPIDTSKQHMQYHAPYQTGYWAPQPPVTRTVLVDRNAFDSAARFNQGAAPVIPPCPPGVAPTAHQIAAAQGQTVVLGKKKGGFFFQKGAGSTFW